MKKWFLALLCLALAGAALAGCAAGNANSMSTVEPAASESPMASISPQVSSQPSASPQTSGMPMQGEQGTQGTQGEQGTQGTQNMQPMQSIQPADMTPADAGRLAQKISEAVERISEVSDAEVIVNSRRVLVAVEFDDQYSAGLDDRMKQQIVEAVRKVDDSITDVEVTDDDTLYGQVKGLGERVANVTGLDELADDFGDLWDRIVGR